MSSVLPLKVKPVLWCVLATVVFLLHASCYLYFFVDDEGITLVYARNLLNGLGLTYASADGPTEGYSNFLHVFTMASLLFLVELAGLHRMWAFVAGGALALASGIAVVALLWTVCRRLGLSVLAATTGALLVALSGPLAVWSNSSLETVPFALAFLGLVATTLPVITRPWLTALVAIVLILLRVDGVFFVVVWLGARALASDAATRRVLVTRVAPAVFAAGCTYLLWRVWYFGDWLTLPMQTKVAHKLFDTDATVVWRDPAGYLLPFVRHAGWPLLFGLATIVAAGFWRNGRRAAVWTCGLAVVVLLTYVAAVGDWMFGYRFTVALIAPLAILCAYAVGSIERLAPRGVVLVVVVVLAGATFAAVRFERRYEVVTGKTSFWKRPSLDPARRFGEYYVLLKAVEPLVVPGMRIAVHEAGFVPFVLGLENVDMLGLTSEFVGSLPSRDAVFTDVGRYYPLTGEPAHHAVHAYLIYRDPDVVIARQSWMRTANHGRLPLDLLDARYQLAAETNSFAIYRRRPGVPGVRTNADEFLENLAHPAYASVVAVNGVTIPASDAAAQVPSLWQGQGHDVNINPRWSLHVELQHATPIHEIYINGTAPGEAVSVEVLLRGKDRADSQRWSEAIAAGAPWTFARLVAGRGAIEAVDVRLTSVSGRPVRLNLQAVRMMGQTPALRDHLLEHDVPSVAETGKPLGYTSMPTARISARALLVSTTPGLSR